ncbi:fidgetin-like protein 1 [Condylostylus longicornis]|uniref:fidgetin-like protein 1 n=1 Tax=Condylostylus longicornis TaxID=2530218 RepID=UPI00244DB784|nr:fidgetin-like protein 1 [Condylostylus longicornis]
MDGDDTAPSNKFNKEKSLAKYLLSFNESLQNDKNNSSTILRSFYSNLLRSPETDLISQNLKKYGELKDMTSWNSSLDSRNYKNRILSKCNKEKICPLSNITEIDVENIFSNPIHTNACQDSELKIKNLEVKVKENNVSEKIWKIQDTEKSSRESSKSFDQPKIFQQKKVLQNLVKSSDDDKKLPTSVFKSAREELLLQSYKNRNSGQEVYSGNIKKTLGTRRTARSEFVSPVQKNFKNIEKNEISFEATKNEVLDDRLINIDPKMIEIINNEVINNLEHITWDDIAGLEDAKSVIKESIIWPILRPDIFTGIRRPPKGILFFGPPGTGKTLIGKCIASESKSKFYSISASSLTSKWIGDGEKMVRALFAVATVNQPSVIFIDEIDSLLCKRTESEHESSRRLKTEFLVQLDGTSTSKDDLVLIIGATNRPQELDDAARRRFVRRLYIPLPDVKARIQIIENLLKNVKHVLSNSDFALIGAITENYSGADIASLCQEACMKPLRSIPVEEMSYFDKNNVRPVFLSDFKDSVKKIKPSVSINDLKQYLEWNELYGCCEIK